MYVEANSYSCFACFKYPDAKLELVSVKAIDAAASAAAASPARSEPGFEVSIL